MTDDLKKVPDILNVVLTPKEQSLVFHRAACKPEVRDVMRRLASRVVKLEEELGKKHPATCRCDDCLNFQVARDPASYSPPAAKEEVRGWKDTDGFLWVNYHGSIHTLNSNMDWGTVSNTLPWEEVANPARGRVLTPTELAPHLENLRAWLAKGGGE